MGMSWRNLAEFEKVGRDALSNFPGKVVFEIISNVLDIKSWIEAEGVQNKHLSLFARHGPGNANPGMHRVRYVIFVK